MPIVYLLPTGETDTGAVIASGALTDVDEGVDAGTPDAALETSIANSWAAAVVSYVMGNLPGDADSINSVTLRARGQVSGGWADDAVSYAFDLVGANAAHPAISWDFQTEDGNALADKSGVVTDSPSVADVNAMTVEISQAFSQDMGPDGAIFAWDGFEIEVDYTASAFTPAAGTSTFSGTLTAVGTWRQRPQHLVLLLPA